MSSVIAGNARTGATAMAQGDYNLFNNSINNHSMNNDSFNKHDRNFTDNKGLTSVQDPQTGGTTTHMGNGTEAYNVGPVSSTTASINTRNLASATLTASAQSSEQQSQQMTNMSQQSLQSNHNAISRAALDNQFTDSLRHSSVQSDDYSLANSVKTVASISERYGTETSKSFQDQVHMGIDGNVGASATLGANPSAGALSKAGISVGISASGGESWRWTDTEGKSHAMASSDAKDYMKSYDNIKRLTTSDDTAFENRSSRSFADNYEANLQRSQIHQNTAQELHQLSMQQNEQAQLLQQSEVSSSMNNSPKFQTYFSNLHSSAMAAEYFHDPVKQQDEIFQSAISGFTTQEMANLKTNYNQEVERIYHDQDIQIKSLQDSGVQVSPEQHHADAELSVLKDANAQASWEDEIKHKLENISNPNRYIAGRLPFPSFKDGNYSENPIANPIRNEVTRVTPQEIRTIREEQERIENETELNPKSIEKNDSALRKAIFWKK